MWGICHHEAASWNINWIVFPFIFHSIMSFNKLQNQIKMADSWNQIGWSGFHPIGAIHPSLSDWVNRNLKKLPWTFWANGNMTRTHTHTHQTCTHFEPIDVELVKIDIELCLLEFCASKECDSLHICNLQINLPYLSEMFFICLAS